MLDALAGCNTVAFDKTGTLTTGSLSCTSVRPLGPGSAASGSSRGAGTNGHSAGSSTASLLGLPPREAAAAKRAALLAAVALSLRSSHPVSDAVVLHGQAAGLDGSSVEVSDFQLVAGGGVEGTISSSGGGRSGSGSSASQRAAFGSLDFVSGRLSAEEAAAVERLAAGQGTSGVLSVLVLQPATSAASGDGNGAAAGSGEGGSARSVWVFSFEDSVRTQSAAAVRALQTVSDGSARAGALPPCSGPARLLGRLFMELHAFLLLPSLDNTFPQQLDPLPALLGCYARQPRGRPWCSLLTGSPVDPPGRLPAGLLDGSRLPGQPHGGDHADGRQRGICTAHCS